MNDSNFNQEVKLSESLPHRYWCFISYRHADNHEQDRQWATWLHQEIEHYEIPAELVGTINQRGDVIPAKIYPVFRDEESLSAEAHLGTGILEALDASQTLVVICSPRAVESKYVKSEIIRFQETGKGDRIITAIIDGEPNHPERECFPESLRKSLRQDGVIDLNDGPLAADFRLPNGHQGFTSVQAYKLMLIHEGLDKRQTKAKTESYQATLQKMKLKTLAGILNLPLEVLRNRDQSYQDFLKGKRVQTLIKTLILFSILVISLVFSLFKVNRQMLQIKLESDRVQNERKKLQRSLAQSSLSNGSSNILNSNKPISACLWFGKALREVGDADLSLQNTACSLLGGWSTSLPIHTFVHDDNVSNISFSPDGRSLVTSSIDYTVRQWDTKTGNPIGDADIHKSNESIVSYSQNGKMFAYTSGDLVIVRESKNNKIVGIPYKHPFDVTALRFSKDEKTLITGCYEGLYFWNIKTGSCKVDLINKFSQVPVSIQFSPDATRMAVVFSSYSAHQCSIYLYDYNNVNRSLFAFNLEILPSFLGIGDAAPMNAKAILLPFKGMCSSIDFSPNSQTIAAGITEIITETGSVDDEIRLWDSLSGNLRVPPISINSGISDLKYCPNGNILSIASGKKIYTYNTETQKIDHPDLVHNENISKIAYSPSGQLLAAIGGGTSATVWNLKKKTVYEKYFKTTISHDKIINSLEFSSDENYLATASADSTARIWRVSENLSHAIPISKFNGSGSVSTISPDAQLFAKQFPDKSIHFYDTMKNKYCDQFISIGSDLCASAFSSDNQIFATASNDGLIQTWDLRTFKEQNRISIRTDGVVNCLKFSKDGKILGANVDNSARSRNSFHEVSLWNVDSCKLRSAPIRLKEKVRMIQFNSTGDILATASEDCSARLWDTLTGLPKTEALPHKETVNSVAFNADGSLLVTASDDYFVKIWNTQSGLQLGQSLKHEGRCFQAVISPDSRIIASASSGGVVILWDLQSYRPYVERLIHPSSILNMVFSPNGSILATACADGFARLWDSKTGITLCDPFQHGEQINDLVFSCDGNRLVTMTDIFDCYSWDMPQIASGYAERNWLICEVVTGRTIVGEFERTLTQKEWFQRKIQLGLNERDKLSGNLFGRVASTRR